MAAHDAGLHEGGLPRSRTGVIEGFYGPPWAPDRRIEVLRWCAERGMGAYVWAPKDDPKHRDAWRDLYDADELAVLAQLVDGSDLRVGWAVGPGLSMDAKSGDDHAALHRKVDQVLGLGVDLVVLALDDLPVRPGQGPEHADIARRLHDHLHGRAELW
ncbi:MAG TPA: beta-N-acetylglucosaminidase domain-containing protein, partial [Acidimicrobiales bacterium]